MNKTLIIILIIIGLLAVFFLGRTVGLFSLTTSASGDKIVIDSEIPCNSLQDCTKYDTAPPNVYCDTTCKFEDVTARVVN